MAETITQVTQPPEFIESESKLYLEELRNAIAGLKAEDLSQLMGPQFVAGLSPLQQEAINKAGGLGSYQPYLDKAASYSGPDAYKAFMSPYQQEVIGTTLSEYDIQAQKGAQGVPAAAIAAGAFGGGREGVQRAEYGSASDRNRAALQANLLQQGFGQAQALAGQAFGQQMNLAQLAPGLAGQEIAGLTTLGGMQQAQTQAGLSAQQQLLQAQSQQPLGAAQAYGSGIMGLISGYPGQTTQAIQPTPSPLQTILGAGSTLAGIYGALNPKPLFNQPISNYV
jgi:hypothetical protein